MTSAAPRLPLVAGNWKMNRGGREGADLARAVVRELGGRAPSFATVALLPPFPALAAVEEAIRGSGVLLGAQDCAAEASGAFTGEVAAEMLAGWGCALVLCGHSERRRRGEDDGQVRAKVAAARRAGIRPVLCVGETAEERDAGRTSAVVARQAKAATAGLRAEDAAGLTVAYEPVWAIGTGRNATPEEAAAGHRAVRAALAESLGAKGAEAVPVIYGGSVTPGNAAALLSAPGVDGALVGGASLDAAGFAAIVKAAGAAVPARGGG